MCEETVYTHEALNYLIPSPKNVMSDERVLFTRKPYFGIEDKYMYSNIGTLCFDNDGFTHDFSVYEQSKKKT
jgi:hypothetical protein